MRSISRTLLAIALALTLAGAVSAPAGAAAVTTQNACQYSYDGYWRDMPITNAGSAAPATAERGDTISLSGRTLNPTLPEWLAEYGYNFGLLEAGENEIPTTVWLATRGVGTEEGLKVQRFETLARTTIYVDGGGMFSHADPFTYDTPELAGTTWTAKGGKVAFRQAGAGSLPQLPVGPGGRLQQPKGSVFILAELGSAQLGLDCVPGGYDGEGASYVEQIASPFATVDVPAFSCLSALPAATNRAPVAVDLAGATLPAARKGVPYRFAPAVDYRLPAAYLQTLYDAGRLKEGDNELSLDVTAAIAAGHASPADVELAGSSAEPVIVRVEDGNASEVAGRVRLAAGSWTPAGGGPLELAAGPAGALGPLDVEGRDEPVRPYGSVYLRLTIAPPAEAANHLSLDCVSAEAAVAGGTPPAYSEGGDQAPPAGDAGRYELDAYRLDPFAIAPLLASVTPTPTPDPPTPPAPSAPPGAGPPQGPPPLAEPPTRAVVAIPKGTLRVKRKQVAIRLRCTGNARCRGTARLRSVKRLRVGKRGRKRIVALTAARSYAIPAGRTRTIKLRLGGDGRKLMAARKRLAVRVEVRPRGATTLSRKVTLRR